MDAKIALVVLCVLAVYCVEPSTGETVHYEIFVDLNNTEGIGTYKALDDFRGVEVLKTKRSMAVGQLGRWKLPPGSNINIASSSVTAGKHPSGGKRRDNINKLDSSRTSTDNNTVDSYNVDNATYINGSLSNVTEYNNTGVSDHSNVHNFTQKLTFSNITNSSVTAALGKNKKYKSIKKIVQIGQYDVTIELIDLQSLLPANRSSLLKSAKKNRN